MIHESGSIPSNKQRGAPESYRKVRFLKEGQEVINRKKD